MRTHKVFASKASAVPTGRSGVRMAFHSPPIQAREPGLCTPSSVIPWPGSPQTRTEVVSWSWEQYPVKEAALCEPAILTQKRRFEKSILIVTQVSFQVFQCHYWVEKAGKWQGRCPVRLINSIMLHVTAIFVTTPNGRLWLYAWLYWLSNSCFSSDLEDSFPVLYFCPLESLSSLYQACRWRLG